MPLERSISATISLPNPFAIALQSSMIRASSLVIIPSASWILRYPVISSRLSIVACRMFSACLKPNPQAFTAGATVISNAPPVRSDISIARRNTLRNSVSSTKTLSERFTADIVELGLNMESALSTSASVFSISSWRSAL